MGDSSRILKIFNNSTNSCFSHNNINQLFPYNQIYGTYYKVCNNFFFIPISVNQFIIKKMITKVSNLLITREEKFKKPLNTFLIK